MEFEGFKRCLDFILNEEMQVSTMISDRHVSIAKYMREEKKDITHYNPVFNKCAHAEVITQRKWLDKGKKKLSDNKLAYFETGN